MSVRSKTSPIALIAAGLLLLGACDNEGDFESLEAEGPGETDTAMIEDSETEEPLDSDAYGEPAEIEAHEDEGPIDQRVVTGTEIVSRDDIAVFIDNAFQRADEDEDGVLDYEEYLVIAPALGQADTNRGDAPGRDTTSAIGPIEEDGPAADSAETVERDEWFRTVAGEDGLSPDEFEAALTERFELADENDDDELSPEEASDFLRLQLVVLEDVQETQ